MTDGTKLTPVQRREAKAELDRHGGDRKAAALALLGKEWPQRRVAAAMGRSRAWAERVANGRAPDPPRVSVRCLSCGWSGKRPGPTPCAKLCPTCGATPVVYAEHRQRPANGKRHRVNVYLDDRTFAALSASGRASTQAAMVLTAWARAKVKR